MTGTRIGKHSLTGFLGMKFTILDFNIYYLMLPDNALAVMDDAKQILGTVNIDKTNLGIPPFSIVLCSLCF